MQASLPPSYAEATLQDLPGLNHMLKRIEFLVYPENMSSKHEIKSSEKELLYKGKWKQTSSCFTMGPTVHNLVITTADKKEVLTMTRTVEGFISKKKEFVMLATPGTPIGRIVKDEKHIYKIFDSAGQMVLQVQSVSKIFSKHYKITTANGTEIGTVGDNSGSKHTVRLSDSVPLSHKCLLLGLALSIQNEYDEAASTGAAAAGAAGGAAAAGSF